MNIEFDYQSGRFLTSIALILSVLTKHFIFPKEEFIPQIAEQEQQKEPMIIHELPAQNAEFQIIEEDACSTGKGILVSETWDFRKSLSGLDIVNNNKKIRGRGRQRWRDNTAFGSHLFESGCNIIDVKIQFDEVYHDEKYDGTAFTMIGIINDEDIPSVNPRSSFAESKDVYAHAIFTRDGFKYFSGTHEPTHNGGIVLYKSGDIVRMILDLDDGSLKFKWKYADEMKVYNISDDLPKYQYRLAASICNEESITIQY